MEIKIEDQDNRIYVWSPYAATFVRKAKQVGGRWNPSAGAWHFPLDARERVMEILDEVYGYSTEPRESFSIQVEVEKLEEHGDTLYLGNRPIASRRSRDYPVTLTDGVFVTDGRFLNSGGSRNYPAVTWEEGTIVQIPGVTKRALEIADLKEEDYKIVDSPEQRKAALEAEKERLLARLAEIEKELEELA